MWEIDVVTLGLTVVSIVFVLIAIYNTRKARKIIEETNHKIGGSKWTH